jgi:triphosphatase
MANEIELKFEIDPDDMDRMASTPWVRSLAGNDTASVEMNAIYFDTTSYRLRDNRVALRVRSIGNRRVQTIKSDTGRPFDRNEWESEIAGEMPDLSLAKGTALQPLLKKNTILKPVFETSVRRWTMDLRQAGSHIELAMDRGEIKTGDRCQTISEIELELKEGDVAMLVDITRRLASEFPLRCDFRSKAERGYSLIEDRITAVHATSIVLDRDATSRDAFQMIGIACLRHLALNKDAVVNGDSEGVHQMRIGIRRFRAAISVFQDMLQDPEGEAVKAGLKRINEQLADARDLDVFISENVMPVAQNRADFKDLLETLEQQKSDAFERVKSAVQATDYHQLVLKSALWLLAGQWTKDSDELQVIRLKRPVLEVAQQVLKKRSKKILKKAERIKKLEPHRRHKLRIATKKLRYVVEFFESLYQEKPSRSFRRALKSLQDTLGKLNDIRVHEQLAKGMLPHLSSQSEFAIGIVVGHESAATPLLLRQAEKVASEMRSLPRFWS